MEFGGALILSTTPFNGRSMSKSSPHPKCLDRSLCSINVCPMHFLFSFNLHIQYFPFEREIFFLGESALDKK